jgi:hypothetical protein
MTASATPGLDWYGFSMLRPCGPADACPPGADTVAEEHFTVDPLGPPLQVVGIDWLADGSSVLQRTWGPPSSLVVTANASTLLYLSAPDGCHSYEATVTVWGQAHQTAPFIYCKPTATPTPAPGALAILDAVPVPHPNARELRVKLGAPAERLRARYYSPAMVLIAEGEQGPVPQGWSSLALPTGLPNGLVYVVLTAWQGQQQSLPRPLLRLYFIP